MKYFDFTLPTGAENLACDEALLDLCEEGGAGEILRFWEPQEYFVVVGYGNGVGREVNVEACRKEGIPIIRRCTGGGTVLQGPGCLNYSLMLQISDNSENATAHPLQSISGANKFILERHKSALEPLLKKTVQLQGQTDLVVGDLKFSGNAQRRRRKFLIFHGTFLLDFDISMIEKFLPMPSKQPCYRQDRSHTQFLTNLRVPPAPIKTALQETWNAAEQFTTPPDKRIRDLVVQNYGNVSWNLRL